MRCMNEGCVDWTRTRNNYCGRFADLADCDEKEPRNLPEADVKPPLCDVLAEIEKTYNGEPIMNYQDAVEIVLSKYFA